MKKITLLGDSIRLLGYGKEVPGLLGDGFEVFQPDDNCRFSKYTLRMLFDYQSQMEGSEVVHWNNGLWDATRIFEDGLFTSEEEYIDAMVRIAKILKERYKTVIFATTTPVHDEKIYFPGPMPPAHDNTDIIKYNRAILNSLYTKSLLFHQEIYTRYYLFLSTHRLYMRLLLSCPQLYILQELMRPYPCTLH